MQAIIETLFDTAYLITVITLGIIMIRKSNGSETVKNLVSIKEISFLT